MSPAPWIETARQLLWGPGTLALLLGTGVFLTVRTRFLPWRNLGYALRTALGREARARPAGGGVSSFSALMTALAATIGTGNIVGVATALAAGGPGALLWMELSALFGLSTKFSECMLAVKHRRKNCRGEFCGGPMYVLRYGVGGPLGAALGAAFALFAALASFGIGSMTQANSIASALHTAFRVPVRTTGLFVAALALLIILGGIRSISRVCAVVVPVMALGYLAAGLAVILGNLSNLPAGLLSILRCALDPRAAAGGCAGAGAASLLETLRWGVSRGVFSNEAGMGSAAISAAAAATSSPVRQGYINMTGTVFDTLVVCTVTGLAICCSGVLGTADTSGVPLNGAALTIAAFQTVLGPAGGSLISLAIALFAFSTILGWEYQGERAFEYLCGARPLLLYRVAFALFALAGAVTELETAFALSDLCNALMAIPNLLCLLLLSGAVARDTAAYQRTVPPRRRRGV